MAGVAGKVAIVTGANCGLGYRATEMLCKLGVEVIMACRSEVKAKEAMDKVKQANSEAHVDFLPLDLSNLQSVKTFADQFLATGRPLHILVNNAGIFDYQSPRQTTADGFELHMATNHIGHFLLTSLLLDKLKETGKENDKARIVVVASLLHDTESKRNVKGSVKDMDYDDFHLAKEGAYTGQQAYKNSKAADVMTVYKLSRLLKDSNVTINTLCPGFIPDTELGRSASSGARFFLRYILGGLLKPVVGVTRSIDHGAGLITQLATDPKHEGETGSYYSDYKVSESSKESRREEDQEKLWAVTKQDILANDRFPDLQLMG